MIQKLQKERYESLLQILTERAKLKLKKNRWKPLDLEYQLMMRDSIEHREGLTPGSIVEIPLEPNALYAELFSIMQMSNVPHGCIQPQDTGVVHALVANKSESS